MTTPIRGVRCVVESMNYSACGHIPGDSFEVDAEGLRITHGAGFCMFAIASVLPLLKGRMGDKNAEECLAGRPVVTCPDPAESLRMRLEPLGGSEHGRTVPRT